MSQGKVYLIPTTLGENNPMEVLPITIKEVILQLRHFIVENEKTARRFIKKIAPELPQSELQFELINKFTEAHQIPAYLTPCMEGISVGVISEAGCPGIADPGAEVVKTAHDKNLEVVPLVGPSSILLALMASGMNGQSFAFNGYLPIDKNDRKQALKFFEKRAKEEKQSQLFIETPYRNDKLVEEVLQVLQSDTLLCIACDLTLPTQYIKTMSVAAWKKHKVSLHKRPAIFIIHKN